MKAGFFDEPDRWTGISHVLEHMFFKGTPRRGVGAIARETKAAGGYLNASTTYDHTSYFTVLPASGLAAALDIQSDALRHSVDRRRTSWPASSRSSSRKPSGSSTLRRRVAHETLHEVMFDRHRIRRWRIGHEAQLARLTRARSAGLLSLALRARADHRRDRRGGRTPTRRSSWPARPTATGRRPPGAVDPSPEEPPRREVRARTLRGDVSSGRAGAGLADGAAAASRRAGAGPRRGGAGLAGEGAGSTGGSASPGSSPGSAAHNYAPTELGVFSIGADLAPGSSGRGARAASRRPCPGSPCWAPARRSWTGRAPCCRRGGPAGWSPWKGRASALAAAEALDGVDLSTGNTPRSWHSVPDQVREAAARYLHPDTVSAVVYLPPRTRARISPPIVWRGPSR